jgi:L-alanine-DL-glutamate epimerase-like enolase superfamily enzyme
VLRATVDDVCASHLVGRDPLAIRDRMAELGIVLGGYLGTEGVTSQALGAIEIALWDIAGKHHGVPVHRLLGAAAAPIALYGTGTTMFDESPDWHARYFDQCLSLGFAGVKVRLGRDLADDLDVVRTVRNHIGPRVLLGVDSYWFHDPDTAIALADAIAPLGIHFFEEPVPQHQLEGLQRVQHSSPVRIAVGERVYSPAAYAELARRDAARVFEPDATLAGGILNCLRIVDIAERHSIEVIPHVGGPTVVGLAANLHWATAARVRLCEYDIDPHQPMITDIGDNPGLALVDLTDGTITAPERPGLGVDVDEDLLDAFPYVAGDTYADVFPDHESGRSASPATTTGAEEDEPR